MDLLVNQELETVPEPVAVSFNTTEGLLCSHFKSVVNSNFKTTTSTSLFGKRQGLKAFQFNTVNHTAVILRLTVFAIALIALF
jgi:hypothetical protein